MTQGSRPLLDGSYILLKKIPLDVIDLPNAIFQFRHVSSSLFIPGMALDNDHHHRHSVLFARGVF